MRAAGGGFVNIRRHLARLAIHPIEGGKLRKPRQNKFREIHRARFTARPGLQAILGDVQDVSVARLIRGRESECEPFAVRIEAQGANHTRLLQPRRREILVRAQIEQIEFAGARFIADVRQIVSVARNRQRFDVPGDMR